MANIAPCSTITLYSNVPITNGQQLAFKTVADQTAYFASKKISGHESTNCTYVRRTGQLKIQDKMGIMLQCNYFSFKNANADFENKTIYCRVTDFSYINNNTVLISYVVDWFQTFMFDVTYESATLEREHLSVTDWSKVISNPYDPDVYEMWTPEDLPVDKSMEKVYTSAQTLDTHNRATGNSDKMWQDTAFTKTGSPVIVVFVSDYDTNEIAEDLFADFDAYIDTMGHFHYRTDFMNECVADFVDCFRSEGSFVNRLPTAVPKAVNIGFIGCTPDSNSNPVLRLQALKDFVNGMTIHGLTCQIIGMYQINTTMLLAYRDLCDNTYDKTFTTYYRVPFTVPKDISNNPVVNKKLYHSPFSYLRVETSNGDSKEYLYEQSVDLQNGLATMQLDLVATLDGLPEIALVPENYKFKYLATGTWDFSVINMNIDERLTFGAFPQVGFTTDAYLTFLSSQYTQNLQSRTYLADQTFYTSKVGKVIGEFSNALSQSGVGTSKLNPLGIITGAINATNEWVAQTNQANLYQEASTLPNLGGSDASAIASGDTVFSKAFDDGKKGFVADQYHAGSMGSLAYYTGAKDASSLKFTRVMLKPIFYTQYDKYFTKYGYNSSRVGIPRICRYMQNSLLTQQLPKFLLQQDGQYETYVKCKAIDVKSTMKPVSEFIEAMFKNGMRFIDGSSLIS